MKNKKLTKKQEKFVDFMVYQDWNQTKCAHLAGYENSGVAATRLMSNSEYAHVQEKMQSLKAVQRTKNEITYEGIARKLGEIRDVALADGSYGPAVTAEIARAKLAGLMVDRKELKIHKIDNMSRDQLELRLQQLVQEHHIVIGGEVEVVKDDKANLNQISLKKDQEEEIVEEIVEDSEEDSKEDSEEDSEETSSDLQEEDSFEE
tara:strand:- start:4119 stop:4733 length:615 start_codon:yes stop_codon:yes gene_type:complete